MSQGILGLSVVPRNPDSSASPGVADLRPVTWDPHAAIAIGVVSATIVGAIIASSAVIPAVVSPVMTSVPTTVAPIASAMKCAAPVESASPVGCASSMKPATSMASTPVPTSSVSSSRKARSC